MNGRMFDTLPDDVVRMVYHHGDHLRDYVLDARGNERFLSVAWVRLRLYEWVLDRLFDTVERERPDQGSTVELPDWYLAGMELRRRNQRGAM